MSKRGTKKIIRLFLPLLALILLSMASPVFAAWPMLRHDAQYTGQFIPAMNETPNTPLNNFAEGWNSYSNGTIIGSPVLDESNNIYYVEKTADSSYATLIKRDYSTGASSSVWSKSFKFDMDTTKIPAEYAPLILGDTIYVVGTAVQVISNTSDGPKSDLFLTIYSFKLDGTPTASIPFSVDFSTLNSFYCSSLSGRRGDDSINTLCIQYKAAFSLIDEEGKLGFKDIGTIFVAQHDPISGSVDTWAGLNTGEAAPIIFNDRYIIVGDTEGKLKVFNFSGKTLGSDTSSNSSVKYLLADSEYLYVFYADGYSYFKVVADTKANTVNLERQAQNDGSFKNSLILSDAFPTLNKDKIIYQQIRHRSDGKNDLTIFSTDPAVKDTKMATKEYQSSYSPAVAESEQYSFSAVDATLDSYDPDLLSIHSSVINTFMANSDSIKFVIPTKDALIASGARTIVKVIGYRNLEPVSNHPPVITITGTPEVMAGETITLNVQASDEDGDTLAVQVFGKPDGAVFTVNEAAATLIWVTPYMTVPERAVVLFSASDGKETVYAAADITINVLPPLPIYITREVEVPVYLTSEVEVIVTKEVEVPVYITVEAPIIDTTAPEVSIIVPSNAAWLNTASQVFIVAKENGVSAGMAAIYYSLDNINYFEYDQAALELGEGRHTIYAYAVDNASNKSEVVTGNVNIDATAPYLSSIAINDAALNVGANEISAAALNLSSSDINVALRLADNLSGIDTASIRTSVNGVAFELGSLTYQYGASGGSNSLSITGSVASALAIGTNNTLTINYADLAGNSSSVIITDLAVNISSAVSCYPNPYNARSGNLLNIRFGIDQDAAIGIYIYDITAKLIYKTETNLTAGNHTLTWDGRSNFGYSVPNGVYLCQIVDRQNKSVIGKDKILVVNK